MRFQDLRLSKHFVLLDFLQDRDLYTGGKPVLLDHMPTDELAMGAQLCRQLLEPLIARFGPCSLAAGYCPEGIGHYQTSPHSWRPPVGAAVDIAFHDWVNLDRAPIKLVEELAKFGTAFERLITYAGSEYICTAWKTPPRYALYENVRSPEGRKPEHVQHSRHPGNWRAHSKRFPERPDWRRGPNEPVFHTRRQLRPQHVRLGRYFTLLDLCRDEHAMAAGRNWVPPLTAHKQVFYARMFSEIMDEVVEQYGRVSVTMGVASSATVRDAQVDPRHRWLMGEAAIRFVMPEGVHNVVPPDHFGIVSWDEEWHPSGAAEVTLVIREFDPVTIYSGGFSYGYYSGEPPHYLPPRIRERLRRERA